MRTPRYTGWILLFLISVGVFYLWQIRSKVPIGMIGQMFAEPTESIDTSDPTYQKVTAVIDGMTIEVDNNEIVRYIGVDVEPCFDQEAADKNAELVLGKTVKLEGDTFNRDAEGRLWRYVWVGERMVNQTLTQEGYLYAKYVRPNIRLYEVIGLGQNEARDKKLGLWNTCVK